MVVPGTQVMRVVENFESHFGKVREQLIPCDSSIQLQDVSKELAPCSRCSSFSFNCWDDLIQLHSQRSFWQDVTSNFDKLATLEEAHRILEEIRRSNPPEVP